MITIFKELKTENDRMHASYKKKNSTAFLSMSVSWKKISCSGQLSGIGARAHSIFDPPFFNIYIKI